MVTDEKLLAALDRLAQSPDFALVRGWLMGMREEADARLLQAEKDIHIGRAQGEVQLLDEILETSENAGTILRQMQEVREGPRHKLATDKGLY
jgi:hypothetical protein